MDTTSDIGQSAGVPFLTIELRDSRGEVLERFFDEGSLGRVRPSLDDVTSPCLRFVGPYGDTVFNPSEAAALSVELKAIPGDDDLYSISRVVELADQCAQGVHVYLWFIGD